MPTPGGPDAQAAAADEVAQLLARPNPSVITSLRPDGSPVSVATWYLWEDGRVVVNMDDARTRVRYLRQDPRTTITVLSEDDWGTHVSMQGRVVAWKADEGLN